MSEINLEFIIFSSDTLGYSYINEYHRGGVRSMDHLLREHQQVRQTGDGKFKIM